MASDLYAGVKIGDPNATFNSKVTLNGNIDWSKTQALAPLEGCQVSLIPPDANVTVKNNTISFTAETPYGDSSFGTITSTGSHIAIDEKGTVKIKASSPVAEDPTCGRVEVEAQTNLRLNVGTSLAINVNTSGQHDEEGKISNSSTQSVDEKRYPAFSINVSNGGLDIECADGDIHFSGKNIVFNAAETLTLNATRAVNILAGFEATEVFAKAAAGLFGFELPASGGGEVVIKAGKFVNDANVSETSSSKISEKAGGAKITETGSSMSTASFKTAGDLNLSTSGNVWIAAGQKMRIEAQNVATNPTGPATPPVWGVSQPEALVIAVNKKNTPLDTAMLVEVEGGDAVTKVSGTGDIGIITETGLIGVLAGAGKATTFEGNVGDLVLKSYKGNIEGEAALRAGFVAGNVAEIGVGKGTSATDYFSAYKPGFGFDKGSGGVTMKTSTGIAAVLGKIQAGIGIGETPSASTNFLAFNATGALLNITGPLTGAVTGATTSTFTGAVTTQITGANTINVTGANTSNVTGANIRNITGLVTDKSATGVTIESPGSITIKASTKVDIIGPSGIFLN